MKKTYDNLYTTTPKVLTPKRHKSKTKNTHVSREHKFNYRMFNQTKNYRCMGNFILINY